MLNPRPILLLAFLAFVYCSAKPLNESKEVTEPTTGVPSSTEHHTTEEGHTETTSGEPKNESNEEKEGHSKGSTEEHVTKALTVSKDHSKHEQKPKEKTTPAPQTNHVSDEHAEASE